MKLYFTIIATLILACSNDTESVAPRTVPIDPVFCPKATGNEKYDYVRVSQATEMRMQYNALGYHVECK